MPIFIVYYCWKIKLRNSNIVGLLALLFTNVLFTPFPSKHELGQSDLYDNRSSGDTSEDLMFDINSSRRSDLSINQGRPNVNQDKEYHGLWSNSSR